MRWKWLVLTIIVIIAGILRLVWLDKYPAGFTPDEAAFGYNAYSLLKTGHDEWGTPFWQLPFNNLRSFGDYKMPLYAFLTVPSVAFFGLTEFSTRLPNAIFGTLAVLIIYFLPLSLIKRGVRGEFVGIISALLLALSPWAMPLSRGAFEANLITFLLPLAILLFFRRFYFLSSILYALSLYSYHSARIIVPLSIAGLFIIYRPKLNQLITQSLLLLLILSLPVFYSLVFSNQRAVDVSIFHPDDGWSAMATRRLELIDSGLNPSLARLVSNKLTFTGSVFLKNYFSYFYFDFLFTKGPAEATYGMLPGTGVLYWIQLPLLIGFLFTKKDKLFYFLLLLLLISPIPAALSKGPGFAANRAAFMVIPLTIMTAFGLHSLIILAKKLFPSLRLREGLGVSYLLIVLSFLFFVRNYLVNSPLIHPRSMGYGFKEAINYISNLQNVSAHRISRSLSEPHIYFAFYQKTDPRQYQEDSKSWAGFESRGFRFLDQYDGYYLDRFRFGDLNFSENISHTTMYLGRPGDFSREVDTTIVSSYPDSSPAIVSAIRKL